MAHERMASVDAAWLGMDDDTQRMVITVMMRFAGIVPFRKVEELVRERVLRHPRFRQRVVDALLPGVAPSWEEDPHFSLHSHLHRVALPEPGDDATLLAMVSDLASTSLDRRIPLWQLHVVEGAPGGTVLVARLHHAIGDGVSLVHFLLSLTDECRDSVPPTVGLQLGRMPHAFVDRAKLALDHGATLAKLLALPFETDTRFRGPLGREKQVAFARPVPIERLKRASASEGAKLNDVLMSICAGAMRRYLEQCGDRFEGEELRAMVPVFFRGHGVSEGLGNHFGLVFAPLLPGLADPRARLRETKKRMDELKGAPDALVALEVLTAMGHAGAVAERVGIEIFTRKASFMITNVPGPPASVHLAGERLEDLVVWAPVAGTIGIGISLLSYAGRMHIGVFADARRMPDPERFVAAVEAEIEALPS